jgi:hypothetical protein
MQAVGLPELTALLAWMDVWCVRGFLEHVLVCGGNQKNTQAYVTKSRSMKNALRPHTLVAEGLIH